MSRSTLTGAPVLLLATAPVSAQDTAPPPAPAVENSPRLCRNGEDDDGDGLVDCDDDG